MASAKSAFFEQSAHSAKDLHRLRAAAWLITISAGFIQAWASRFSISPDGNSYLDIASAYLSGDWNHAISAFWSPFSPGSSRFASAYSDPAPTGIPRSFIC